MAYGTVLPVLVLRLAALALAVIHFAAPLGAQEVAPSCDDLTRADRVQQLLALDQPAFDQDMEGGWRPIAAAGCHADAARLLDTYVARRPELTSDNPDRVILRFHAGQLYAFAGMTDTAIERLLESHYPETLYEMITSQGSEQLVAQLRSWDAYVNATLGFLRGDREQIEAARPGVAQGPALPSGEVANLAIVDRFLAGIGQPYAEVYGGTRDQ